MRLKSTAAFVVLCCVVSIGQEKAPAAPAAKATSISGTVTRADTHLPVKNVQVTISGERVSALDEDESTLFRTTSVNTNDKGNFEFANLPPGSYYVLATHTGMIMKGARLAGMLIHVEAGQSPNLILVMLPGGAITGRVLNEEGEPMQNVSVAAMQYIYTEAGRRLGEAKRATSDDKGEYRLFSLKPGSYLLMADTTRASFEDGGATGIAIGSSLDTGTPKQDQKIYAPTYYQNESSPEQASPIVLKPGEETQANFALVRVSGHHISGKLSGVPAPKSGDKPEQFRAFVTAMKQGSQFPVGMAVVGKDSTFDIGPVAPGKYKIRAIHPESEGAVTGSKEVVVSSTDVTGVNLSLHGGSTQIRGVIRAEGESKLDYTKLFVVLMPVADSDNQSEFVDMAEGFGNGSGYSEVAKDGSFKLDLEPSSKPYQVVLSARGPGLEDWFTSKILFAGKDVVESGLKITDAEQRTVEVIVSDKGAIIEGTVLDGEKKPFPNAEVIALPSDPKLRRRYALLQKTTADQQGHFKLRGVRPGEYIAFALEDPREQPFMEDLFLKQNSAQVQTVKAEAGAKQKLELQVILSEAQ